AWSARSAGRAEPVDSPEVATAAGIDGPEPPTARPRPAALGGRRGGGGNGRRRQPIVCLVSILYARWAYGRCGLPPSPVTVSGTHRRDSSPCACVESPE